jgi:hypothetical protein
LQISESTISRDLDYLRQQSKDNIRKYIDERLPEEYDKCLVGLTSILREAWNTAQQTTDKREKIQALSLAKECYSMKLDLLTNATVVDDAIRFVSSRLKVMNSNTLNLSVHPMQTDIEKNNDKEYGKESDIKTTNEVF